MLKGGEYKIGLVSTVVIRWEGAYCVHWLDLSGHIKLSHRKTEECTRVGTIPSTYLLPWAPLQESQFTCHVVIKRFSK